MTHESQTAAGTPSSAADRKTPPLISLVEVHALIDGIGDAVTIDVTPGDESESYRARLLAISHELDLALITVDNAEFFEGATPLEPQDLQAEDAEVVAYGYRQGGVTLDYAAGSYWYARRMVSSHPRSGNLQYAVDTPTGRPVLRR